MKLREFSEQNAIFAEDQPEYLPLPAYRVPNDSQGRIICCWQLSWRERFIILITGRLWHSVLTFNAPLQPQLIETNKPLMEKVGMPAQAI